MKFIDRDVVCDYCGEYARLVNGSVIYPRRADLHGLLFWFCGNCKAYVGTHKNSGGVPLGRLADSNLRRAKNQAHAAFDPLWKNGGMKRSEAYSWLARELNIEVSNCHIGMFDIETCNRVVQITRSYMNAN